MEMTREKTLSKTPSDYNISKNISKTNKRVSMEQLFSNTDIRNNNQSDNVNHPQHYNDGKIEVIDYIEDKKLDFHLGNAVKYISRAGKKCESGEDRKIKKIEDLNKAIWYIQREIKFLIENEWI